MHSLSFIHIRHVQRDRREASFELAHAKDSIVDSAIYSEPQRLEYIETLDACIDQAFTETYM